MPKNPLNHNPEYTFILFAIVNNYKKPKQIKRWIEKFMNPIITKNEQEKIKLSKQNLSKKLQYLKSLNFVKSEKNNYSILYSNIIRHIINEFFIEPKKSPKVNKTTNKEKIKKMMIESKAIKRLFKAYFIIINKKKINISQLPLFELFHNWIIGIGYYKQIEQIKFDTNYSLNQKTEKINVLLNEDIKKGIKIWTKGLTREDIIGFEVFKNKCQYSFLSTFSNNFVHESAEVIRQSELGYIDFEILGL